MSCLLIRPPSYLDRFSSSWKPLKNDDFNDGGAFPEINIPQFPLGMGEKKTSSSIIPLNVDGDGKINFTAVLGIHDKKKVYSSAKDLVEYNPEQEELLRPSEEEEKETTEKTQQALSKKINTKIAAAIPAKPAQKQIAPTYYKYNPEGENKMQRVIKLVETPVDPLEPPKFKHKKVARGPGSPPVPIVHSPPRKLTKKDFEEWKIPPCISNWKNQRGLTIALDKRLAADGRGLQKPQINDKFAQFAESLYLAERHARNMVEQRLEINRLMSEQQRREKEEQLAEMAARARNARTKNYSDNDKKENIEDIKERERLREERRKQTEREMRLENLKGKRKRDENRDISERIALGQAQPTLTGESMFDQRLFNQSHGISQGFGSEDSYNVFDKPLFNATSTQLFRPKKNEDLYGSDADLDKLKNTNRFQPDKGFKGAESSNKSRSNPVEFEKQQNIQEYKEENYEKETDDFDFLDDYMDEVKSSKMDDVLSKSMMTDTRRFDNQQDNQKYSSLSPKQDKYSNSPSPNQSNRYRDYSPSPPRRQRRDYSPKSPYRKRNYKRNSSRSPSPYSRRNYNRRSRSPGDRRYNHSRDRDYRRGPYDRPNDRGDRRDRRDYRRERY